MYNAFIYQLEYSQCNKTCRSSIDMNVHKQVVQFSQADTVAKDVKYDYH